jgi:cation diffusion facilitator CzcD-associated flavoprotein CzcO
MTIDGGHDVNGHTNGTKPANWEPLLDQPAYTPTRRLRVVCIGAGMSGLMLAYKVQHEFKLEDEIDLVIYDRNPELGGTWYENTYPGASS